MKCMRCGMSYKPGETKLDHTLCDESFDEETWTISPEELAARAERVKEYQKRIKTGVVTNAKK